MPQAKQPDQARRDLPLQQREAQIVPGTFNEADNTVDVVWTAGARVRRYDWWAERPYEEELVVSEEAVDMSRFEAGAVQVLDNHRSYGGVEAILGIATRGWLDGAEGRATLRLSTRPELAGIVADIRGGIIRTISVGYNVARYEIVRAADRTDGINVDLYRAARWTPMELSFVTVPADPAAGTRQATELQRAAGRTFACEFIEARAAAASQSSPTVGATADPLNSGERSMTPEELAAAEAQRTAEATRAAQQAAQTAERERSGAITEVCTRHGVAQLASGLIASGATVDAARAAVLEELARRDAAAGGHRNVRIETVGDETQTRLAGIEEAIAHRLDTRATLTDNGRQYRGMSLLEIGREHLERSGVSTRGLDRMTLATRLMQFRSGGAGMQTVSDFASLLANVANKRLRGAYTENPGTYRVWARKAPNAPDFKSMTVVQISGAPDLLQVNEHGEFTYGVMQDGKETYGLLTYGRIVSLSRQAIVNDDLRGFDRMVTAFGFSAARLENRTVYSQLTANAAMGDGTALFHADHANLGTGSALAIGTLGAMRTAMRKQKGLQQEELNITPSFLIVPAALEQTAYQLTSSNYVPATKAEVNEFRTGGRTALEPVIEPILDANSATTWYAAASSTQVDTVEYCYLDGNEGPVIESEMGFEVDGMSMKCRHDFAAKPIDYRGLYKATA